MQDNSRDKKKTLVVSVLAFLFIGGGVFLFFIIQGSNDLTGKGKSSFTYGAAAREGVSSFFKSIGVVPDEEAIREIRKDDILAAYGFMPDGKTAGDLSDWMSKDSAATAPQAPGGSAARPSAVPNMSKTSMSQPGGGGGSSQSSGSSSRFGGGDNSRATSVSASAKTEGSGAAGKGTLGALKNARAMLGEGLRSDSAMTARSKWGQSFGVGGSGGKSGELAYNKSGLVGLDKIKSGEIASLKMDKKGAGLAPEAGAFERDKNAESKDANLQAKNAESKANMENEAKKAAAQAALDGLGKGLNSSTPKDPTGDGKATPPGAPITEEENALAKSLTTGTRSLSDGSTFANSTVVVSRNPDGGATFNITGAVTPKPGSTEPPASYTFTVSKNPDGTVTAGEFVWKTAP